ncbi:hypothetical protein PYW08_015114 [Mythimna loreyi]|uniref:Uncharacterized protein n=1 Tax=Mythimna loreyi TaxID=667449 RepID=A0ACC2QWZ4_9NEOP|nr:hypothetical protein PYW08_015114 [Mythimna loreyi]
MSALSSLLKLFTARQSIRPPRLALSCLGGHPRRTYSDKPEVTSKRIVSSQLQGPDNEERVRVRRARPSDVPRVLRFVREHARVGWPGLVAPPSTSHLILCDYVARALAQGHSMLAEQQESRRGWTRIRGLALGMSVCPWDASMLEKWARCVRCTRSRRLMHFTAHCLRAPALHDKYQVHNILQVILIVPQDCSKSSEIVHMLVKNAIQRGRDAGFSVLRFDVTDDTVGSALEGLQLKKEWQLMYDVLPESMKEKALTETHSGRDENAMVSPKFIAVYTSVLEKDEPNKKLTSETRSNNTDKNRTLKKG